MSKDKILSCFFGFLLFSSGGNDTAYGMNKTTSNAGVGQSVKMTGRRLDSYHLMIASKYFETIDDFINLEFATKKAKDNMEKFHFNPIALDSWSREFFTSLETLHVYNKTDEHFIEEEFYRRVIWYPCDYTKDRDINTTYHNLVFTNEFVRINFTSKREISVNDWPRIENEATKIALDNKCFSSWHGNTIELPTYVTRLGDGCFEGRTAITRLILPEHLREVGEMCFGQCKNLTEIKLPNSCTAIRSHCFYHCVSLTSVILPKNIPALPDYGFAFCCSLKSIEIPTTVSFIGSDAFSVCRLLSSIKIPTTVSFIGDRCFTFCYSLSSIEIPQSVTKLKTRVFSACDNLQNVILPEGLKAIEYGTFKGCRNLTQLTLPSTLEYINGEAFRGCSNLTIINKSSQLLQADNLGVKAVENVGESKALDTEQLKRNNDA